MIDISNVKQEKLRVIVGAGATKFDGWISTQEDELNLLNPIDWELSFGSKKIDIILAEHVWEHMDAEEGTRAAEICYEHLSEGGFIRCAVPDRYFRNEWYQNMVQVGGPGPKDHPAATHKIVYTYKTLTRVFERAGFEVKLLEYFDEEGKFHFTDWDENDGKIGRSLRFDTRNKDGEIKMASLIIDAVKPYSA